MDEEKKQRLDSFITDLGAIANKHNMVLTLGSGNIDEKITVIFRPQSTLQKSKINLDSNDTTARAEE